MTQGHMQAVHLKSLKDKKAREEEKGKGVVTEGADPEGRYGVEPQS